MRKCILPRQLDCKQVPSELLHEALVASDGAVSVSAQAVWAMQAYQQPDCKEVSGLADGAEPSPEFAEQQVFRNL